jgi:carbonic anhydrase
MFRATEFVLHHPSEHTINGKYYDLEMHIKHKLYINTTDEDADPSVVNDLTDDIKFANVALMFSV